MGAKESTHRNGTEGSGDDLAVLDYYELLGVEVSATSDEIKVTIHLSGFVLPHKTSFPACFQKTSPSASS